jgi:hypothetical protein
MLSATFARLGLKRLVAAADRDTMTLLNSNLIATGNSGGATSWAFMRLRKQTDIGGRKMAEITRKQSRLVPTTE